MGITEFPPAFWLPSWTRLYLAVTPAFVHTVMSPVPDVDVVMAVAAAEPGRDARATVMMMTMPVFVTVTVTMAYGLELMRRFAVTMFAG